VEKLSVTEQSDLIEEWLFFIVYTNIVKQEMKLILFKSNVSCYQYKNEP
jgi:hypothetical protein